jgi:hypothetical protein
MKYDIDPPFTDGNLWRIHPSTIQAWCSYGASMTSAILRWMIGIADRRQSDAPRRASSAKGHSKLRPLYTGEHGDFIEGYPNAGYPVSRRVGAAI